MIANLPYNIRCARNDEYSSHDLFASGDITAIFKRFRDILWPGAYKHIFCIALLLELWYRYFPGKRRCWKGLVALILVLQNKKRRKRKETMAYKEESILHQYNLLLGFTIISLPPAFHTILMLVENLFSSGHWFYSGGDSASIDLSGPQKIPSGFHGGQTR